MRIHANIVHPFKVIMNYDRNRNERLPVKFKKNIVNSERNTQWLLAEGTRRRSTGGAEGNTHVGQRYSLFHQPVRQRYGVPG